MAREVSALLFEKADPGELSDAALSALRAEIPFVEYTGAEVTGGDAAGGATRGTANGGIDIFECLTALKFVDSRGAARRVLEQGGVSVNGVKLSAADRHLGDDRLLRGRHLLVKKGQKEFGLVHVTADAVSS